MPGINKYEGKIPHFYRKRTIEILMFAHVTVLREREGMGLRDAIRDFLKLYGIDENEFPVESTLVMYNKMLNSYIYVKKILPSHDPKSFIDKINLPKTRRQKIIDALDKAQVEYHKHQTTDQLSNLLEEYKEKS